MKTKLMIALTFLLIGAVSFHVEAQKSALRAFTLDQTKYSCGNADVLILLSFTPDSVKGIQQTFGEEGAEICAEPSGCLLAQPYPDVISGFFFADNPTGQFKEPIPFSVVIRDNKLEESKLNGTKYHFKEIPSNNFSMWLSAAVNLREQPSSNAKVLTKVPSGQSVNVIEFGNYSVVGNKKGFWTMVKFGNLQGWVFGSFLTYTDPNAGNGLGEEGLH
jgi:hypothetical protein